MSSSTIAVGPSPRERALLAAARAGDHDAYRHLVEPHRGELHAHSYRMLGSVQDAEDAVQDALLRAWRALPRFEGRSTTRSWLYRITTNACLTRIARRPKRVLPVDGTGAAPLVETVWLEPYPDERLDPADGSAGPDARYDRRESVELAFIAALQHLPGTQRAVLILREVLGFSAAEAAEILDTSVPSVNSALQRARKAVGERLPDQSQQAALRALGDRRLGEIVERYVDAWERGDAAAIVAMLAADATFSMPPNAEWYRGRAAILDFLPRGPLSMPRKFVTVGANGHLAFGTYCWEDEPRRWRANAIHLLTLRADGEIAEMTAFLDRGVFGAFGLPEHITG
jgi:RNA polymerase sigma-70 factor, ECF subfamily